MQDGIFGFREAILLGCLKASICWVLSKGFFVCDSKKDPTFLVWAIFWERFFASTLASSTRIGCVKQHSKNIPHNRQLMNQELGQKWFRTIKSYFDLLEEAPVPHLNLAPLKR